MSSSRQRETQRRIEAQQAIVDSLSPNSPEHQLATRILLLLKDSFHLLQEIDSLTTEAKLLKE